MLDAIIKREDIYIQDIIHKAVFSAPPDASDIDIYNIAIDKLDVNSMTDFQKIWGLVQLNLRIKEQYLGNSENRV